ncbi:DoxX family protein [Specibacter sp. RAF43]|uniref:DoxX family protein n=1 Tax=Specibacter sp. RAF43 TaxID=3233057 RepID=UPI003F96C2D3
MNVFLWIVQILLACMFLLAGVMKSTRPIATLAQKMSWVNHYPAGVVRLVGAVELLAAIGLVLPLATGIAPILTPLAAVGLAAVMVLAAVYHLRHKEFSGVGINAVLFLLAAVVAWGRLAG